MNLLNEYKLIDLTHEFSENMPAWPNSSPLRIETTADYDTDGIRLQKYSFSSGIGTHMDSPAHFIKGGREILDLKVRELVVPTCVIDVREKVNYNPSYAISKEDLLVWEKSNGMIPNRSLVLACTGWSSRWPDEKLYQNMDPQGTMRFPGFGKSAAELLVERKVVGIGVDTLSVDACPTTTYPVHFTMLGYGAYQLENLTNLELLPLTGSIVFALPLKVRTGAEAPARVMALVPCAI